MEMEDLLTEWRIWLLVIGVVIATFAIGPHYVQEEGRTTIGTNINKGLDLVGGTRFLVAPNGTAEEGTLNRIVRTLRLRTNAFGLKEIKIRPVQSARNRYVQVEAAGANATRLRQLIEKQGRFEARFHKTVTGNDSLTVGERTYNVHVTPAEVRVGGSAYVVNDTFTLASGTAGPVEIAVRNRSTEAVTLSLLAFDGSEVKKVLEGGRQSGVFQQESGWQFRFQVVISQQAAERFKAVAQAFAVRGARQNAYLTSPVRFILDRQELSALRVAATFKEGGVVTQPSISGGAQTKREAVNEMQELQSILESGSLPVPITIVSANTISPALGAQFTQIAVTAILVAVLAVSLVLFLRYRDYRIVIPIALTGFSEVFLLLGFFSTMQLNAVVVGVVFGLTAIGVYFCYRESIRSVIYLPLGAGILLLLLARAPTLDLAAVAGIVAAVGTGVDDQIVIMDEGSKKELASILERIKRAFRIIFTAAGTTIAAMIPLYFVGAGALRGFALTTIVGILIGVFVTRPAFSEIFLMLQEE